MDYSCNILFIIDMKVKCWLVRKVFRRYFFVKMIFGRVLVNFDIYVLDIELGFIYSYKFNLV